MNTQEIKSGKNYELSLQYCEEVADFMDRKLKKLRIDSKKAETLAEKIEILKEISNREKVKSAFRSLAWDIQDLIESQLDRQQA